MLRNRDILVRIRDSGSADPYFRLTAPDSDPYPPPDTDPATFFRDLQDANKKIIF